MFYRIDLGLLLNIVFVKAYTIIESDGSLYGRSCDQIGPLLT